MSNYNGKVPWRAYEVKLAHMARQYNWTNCQKLDKLVEALQDKALTLYSNLAPDVHNDYDQVNRKFNARFGPKEPPQTVRNQLKVVKQKADEPLEEFCRMMPVTGQ